MMHITETPLLKLVRSPGYNYNFDKVTGFFARWGETPIDDPAYSPYGNEILDLEISTGDCSGRCSWCYKANTAGNGHHMSFDTFKKIFDKVSANRILTQIAFGITDADASPDFPEMMRYCRDNGVIPNYTTSGYGMTPGLFELTAELCGAVAVSVYPHNKELAYDTVERFTLGVEQTNIHLLYYQENIDFCYEVMEDTLTYDRLSGLNALVLLAMKPVGRAQEGFTPLTESEFCNLAEFAFNKGVSLGFDSCSAPKYETWVGTLNMAQEDQREMIMMSESCESTLFSAYINVDGEFWPCSFTEGQDWFDPINVLEVDDFVEDVWYAPQTVAFRERLLDTAKNGCRHCPVFKGI